MDSSLLISFGIGYLCGAIPFALLVVKLVSGKDVSREGSGNVGAHNSMDVTGSKLAGLAVLLLDVFKGILAILLAQYFFGKQPFEWYAAAVGAIAGHNFNVFLKFKGGRGLATAAGVLFALNTFPLMLWLVMYPVGYFMIKKHVNVASAFATAILPLLAYRAPDYMFYGLFPGYYYELDEFRLMLLVCAALILLRHISPVMKTYSKSITN